jgi:hypothetical protein
MADPPSDSPELTRALQVVTQNLLYPAIGNDSTQPKWVPLAGSCWFHNSDSILSKRKRPLDPEDTENDVLGDASNTMSKNYCSFGRIYSRQASPFNTIDSVVNFGIKHEAADDDSDIEPTTLTTQ